MLPLVGKSYASRRPSISETREGLAHLDLLAFGQLTVCVADFYVHHSKNVSYPLLHGEHVLRILLDFSLILCDPSDYSLEAWRRIIRGGHRFLFILFGHLLLS